MTNEEIVKEYDHAINTGAQKAYTQSTKEYKDKREESGSSGFEVIISPSRSSFYVDCGNFYTIFHGKCQRQAFFESKSFPVTNLPSTSSIRKMKYGQIYEEQEHIYEELAGILIEKNYRMNYKISDKVGISGEVDSIVKLSDGNFYIIEDKSYDGYYAATWIQGTRTKIGLPKYEHVAQNMLYLVMIEKHFPITKVIFHYRRRSDMQATYHILELETKRDDNGNIIDAYPKINGKVYTFVTLRDLLSRGINLSSHIINNTLPPRDPEYYYSEDKIRYLYQQKEVSKSQFEKWQSGSQVVGNWQCQSGYCPYHNICLGNTPQNKLTYPSDDDIMKKIDMYTIDDSLDELLLL